MMVRIVHLLALGCMFGVCLSMRETCTNQGFSYVQGQTFYSNKADGSQYRCRCSNRRCLRITCDRSYRPTETPPPTPTPEEEEDISGEVGETTHTTDSEPLTPTVSSEGDCYDAQREIRVASGESMLRRGSSTAELCSCTNGVYICEPTRCSLPPPPRRPASYNFLFGCHDPWNNKEYRSGATYTRTRFMDSARQLVGVYNCTCYNNMMRCSALDIPCCDLKTGRFVAAGNTFHALLGNTEARCTCEGQRGRYSNCLSTRGGSISFERPRIHYRPQVTPTPHPRYRRPGNPRRDPSFCKDPNSGRNYIVNSRWEQSRSGRICTCKHTGWRGPRIECRPPTRRYT